MPWTGHRFYLMIPKAANPFSCQPVEKPQQAFTFYSWWQIGWLAWIGVASVTNVFAELIEMVCFCRWILRGPSSL